MFFLVYKITNKINGKYYIGKHKTSNINDGYMGSGKLIKRAIKKHGIENFSKEILHYCSSEEEMNKLEKELVVISEETYNLCPGGMGGFGYINSTPELIAKRDRIENKRKGYERGAKLHRRVRTKEELKKQGEYVRDNKLGFFSPNSKKPSHTPESKAKIGKANSIHQSGTKNNNYGKCWITDGRSNLTIKKEDLPVWLERGYIKGRIMAVDQVIESLS